MLTEFDADWALAEGIMIRIFQKNLSLSVRVEMNQRGCELDSFREIIERAVNAEAKAKLRLSSNTCEMDQNYPQGNRPVQLTIAQSLYQARLTEDPQGEPGDREFIEAPYKSKTSHLLQFCSLHSKKPDKKSWREKKEQYCHKQRQGQNSKNLVPRGNTVANGGGRKDLSYITCFNYNKKGHYMDKCLEPWQNHANMED